MLDPSSNPIIGFFYAGVSTSILWISDKLSLATAVPQNVIEMGGTIGLIAGLSYGCITLWTALKSSELAAREERERHREEVTKLYKEDMLERKEQNANLIEALNKINNR